MSSDLPGYRLRYIASAASGVTRPVAVPTSSPRDVSTSSQVVQTWFSSRSPNSMLGLMPSRFQNCVRDWKITRESK